MIDSLQGVGKDDYYSYLMPRNLVHQPSDLHLIESEWYYWSVVKGVPRVEIISWRPGNSMALQEHKDGSSREEFSDVVQV